MNKTVVITGASGGIGRALVKELHSIGYSVIALDLVDPPQSIDGVIYLKIDISDVLASPKAMSEMKLKISELIGTNDLCAIINNAAVQILKPVTQIELEDWRLTFDVNLITPFFWIQMLLSELEKSKGSVLNISSIHSRLTKKNFTVYATSKAALSSLTKILAIELGERIRVNAIEPGAISTQMLEDGFSGLPKERLTLNDFHPTKRIGTPKEVAELAVFLISDQARFINGSVISIDGGIGHQLHDPA